MKYFVWWSTGKYDAHIMSIFDHEKDVLELLNKHADNTEFQFTVVEGSEIKFKPVTIVHAYERER